MWDYILTFLVGAAIPISINWLQRRDERKQFELERKDKYKLAAIDKRLETHQQAYIHWYNLYSVVLDKPGSKRSKVIDNTRDFWIKNNLYLESKTRNDFLDVMDRVSNHPRYLYQWVNAKSVAEGEKAEERAKENFRSIEQLGMTIQSDVQLEPIALTEESKSGRKKRKEK